MLSATPRLRAAGNHSATMDERRKEAGLQLGQDGAQGCGAKGRNPGQLAEEAGQGHFRTLGLENGPRVPSKGPG